MDPTLSLAELHSRFNADIRTFHELQIPGKIKIVDLSDLKNHLRPGGYRFVAFRRQGESGLEIGGLVIAEIRMAHDTRSVYSHGLVARSVGYSPDECFGGDVSVDSSGDMTLNMREGPTKDLSIGLTGASTFQNAFAQAKAVSEVVGVCLVDPQYMIEVRSNM